MAKRRRIESLTESRGTIHSNDTPPPDSSSQKDDETMIEGDEARCSVDNKAKVCFGVITKIAATYEHHASKDLPSSFGVQLDSPSQFSSQENNSFCGRIPSEYAQMLEDMMDEETLDLCTVCTIDARLVAKKRGRTYMLWPCTLEITVYGPFELFDSLGKWFQDYEVHLQDPRVCHLETLYCNPQRLSSVSPWPFVSEVVSQGMFLVPREVPERPDFLDILSSHVDLEETPQPLAIQTILKSHQKQALTFMMDRERGWGFNRGHPDVWDTIDTGSGRVFLNTISHVCQPEEPLNFYGGIIADPMGFGKTLTMISLVATDGEAEETADVYIEESESDKPEIAATLVIIPPPCKFFRYLPTSFYQWACKLSNTYIAVLSTWEEQILEHVVEGQLVCRRHHGKTRINSTNEINSVNIILTTYHTVSADWRSVHSTGISPIFAVRWKRIILDEAHFIRNGNARMARAVCDLEARSRWAVTGTPIQNRLGDLASLLRFIRAYPYTDTKKFDADISRPWKSGEDKEAVKRLERLSACLLLRRPKSAIDLLPRRDLICAVDFTKDERDAYERIRRQTIISIDEAFGNYRSLVYVNVLQQIESLRLFSNLGLHYASRHSKPSQQSSELEHWNRNAQRTFNSQREIASITCIQCSSTLGITDTLLDDTTQLAESAQFTSCLKFVCIDCAKVKRSSKEEISCGHRPLCPVAPVSTSGVTLEEIEDLITPNVQPALFSPPSKIKALLTDIKGVPSDVKCIVFSTWRLTLDLISRGLEDEGIRSIRFDGKVPQRDRPSVLNSFNSDPNVRVMLLTLSCGAVGLTLTAASRAYLMEPHWNPTLEEQALARIHRLGQVREVETVRFYVRDSFEEQVMKLQESKKQLASVLLSPHDKGSSNDNLGTLEVDAQVT
ncbi:hypothetical protein NPX13_g5978 [Xylaria arbuscula]|uniref:Uncharacterized protein n=1 Tax=Xylaria arbuscula TaxID=114810 RepID=A0A9W8NDD6_9PEZI|nr:hypothetical protein NPX13_g5978 [Xylaria arbuscula]